MRRMMVLTAMLAGLIAGTGTHANAQTVLRRETTYLASPVCLRGSACTVMFKVRPGEQYLHLVATSIITGAIIPARVSLDVHTVNGRVNVCADTSAGPLNITGFQWVEMVPYIIDAHCQSLAVTVYGQITAYFSEQSMSLADAIANATDDPERPVVSSVY